MIAKIQDHVILLIDRKYAERIEFLKRVEKLSSNKQDVDYLEEALTRHEQIFAVYRSGKLKAWYVPKRMDDVLKLDRSFVDPKLSENLKEKLEKEIRKELLSQCIKGHCHSIEWNGKENFIDRKPIYRSILSGILFGLIMGLLFGYFTKSTPLGIAIGLLWSLSMAYVFAASEVSKQQDAIV